MYNKTVKVWLFRDTGSIHYPSPMFISLGCVSGNKPGLGAMETAYIPRPHYHTLSVGLYYCTDFMFQEVMMCVTYSYSILFLIIFNFLLVFKICQEFVEIHVYMF